MPTGKVKWYNAEKGFGFIAREDGGDVHVHSSALPPGVAALKPGQRVEFGIADGRRGESALNVQVLDHVSNTLRRGKHPDRDQGHKVARLLRAVADQLDV